MDWDPYARQLFDTLGEPATYCTAAEAVPVTAIVRRDLQLEPDGFQGQAATRQVRIDMLVAEIGDVRSIRRGESVRTATDCYLVERVEADDGIVVRVLCYLSEYARARV